MTDARDLESSLAEMDRKLRELQRELELVSRGQEPRDAAAPGPAAAPAAPAPPPPHHADILEQATARVGELSRRIEELSRLRDDLDEATRALYDEQRTARAAAAPPTPAPEPPAPAPPEPAPPAPPAPAAPAPAAPAPAAPAPRLPAAGDVAVNAGPFPDIATLSAFEHALQRVDGVDDAVVRSFEGNRALVDVRLTRPIDLAAALRGAVPFAFDVVAAGRGELTLTLRLPTG
jgi:hypothetical protein